jgi:hypothetical protein
MIMRKIMTKKVKLNKAILGKKNFASRVEVEYYRRYETMKLSKKLIKKVHEAVGICEGYIPAESIEEELEAWQYLIDTGVAWQLQGWFGRQANHLIENNFCKPKTIN